MLLALALGAAACKSEDGVTVLPAQLPFCAARAPENKSGFYPADALPQGACKDDPKCQMQIERPCACSAVGPVDDYTCTCTNGTWSCAIAQQGGACGQCVDASTGADAAKE